MTERLPWFLAHRPDVLGLLRRHAEVMHAGLAALARWSAGGGEADVQALRDAEHEGDHLRRELLEAVTAALTTPIEQEHAFALSERIDEVLNAVKDTVRVAGALGWEPDGCAARMAACAEEAGGRLVAAVGGIGEHAAGSRDEADEAIKAARRVEHELLAGLAALPRDLGPWELQATFEVYRRYAAVGAARVSVADRTLYTILRLL